MSAPVTSEVLAAAVIVVVEVVSADLGPDVRAGSTTRHGPIEVEVEEVLKGRITAAPGERLGIEVDVRADVGIWSARTARAGLRLVAFCDGGSTDLRVLLESDLRALVAADDVLDDVRRVRSVQGRHLTADKLLLEAEQEREVAGATFARYVWVAAREALRTSAERFDRLMRVAEDDRTRVDAQEAYLLAAYEDITFTGEFPTAHRARLVRAMVASALDPRLGELRGLLLGTYVPNLVSAALPDPLAPDDVFGDAAGAALRAAVVTELDDPRDPATTSPALSAWLATGGGR